MKQSLITFSLSNFSAFAVMLAILLASLKVISYQKPHNPVQVIDVFLAYLLLFAGGVAGTYGFIIHAFFPHFAAEYIGWQQSPFELTVAAANLSLAITGFISFRASFGFRLATIISMSCFLWGAAISHIRAMWILHDFASGNAGSIFFIDIILPFLLLILVIRRRFLAKNL